MISLIKLIFTDYHFREKKRSVNFLIIWNKLSLVQLQNNPGASDKTGSSVIYNGAFFQKYPDSSRTKTDFPGSLWGIP